MFQILITSLSMYFFCNSRTHVITFYFRAFQVWWQVQRPPSGPLPCLSALYTYSAQGLASGLPRLSLLGFLPSSCSFRAVLDCIFQPYLCSLVLQVSFVVLLAAVRFSSGWLIVSGLCYSVFSLMHGQGTCRFLSKKRPDVRAREMNSA
jgi:hypothetical protein